MESLKLKQVKNIKINPRDGRKITEEFHELINF